jgi:ABC-type transport system substrate-binding protein
VADVTVLPRQEYLDDVWRDRRYEMSVMCWASPLSDPDDFVGGQFRWGRRHNVEQYSGATLTEAIDGALEICDRAERSTAYRAIQRLLLEESPRVPTVFPVTLRAHTDRLRNYVPQRNGRRGSLTDPWLAS